jgi:hypothetical protein
MIFDSVLFWLCGNRVTVSRILPGVFNTYRVATRQNLCEINLGNFLNHTSLAY